MAHVGAHLREWDMVRMDVGQALLASHIRSMLVRILPEPTKQDVNKDMVLNTFQQVLHCIDGRLAEIHDEHIADFRSAQRKANLAHVTGSPYNVTALVHDQESSGAPKPKPAPQANGSLAAELEALKNKIADLQNRPPPRGRDPIKRTRTPRGRSPLVRAMQALNWPMGKFFQCRGDHRLDVCPEWLAACEKNKAMGGDPRKPPAGHKTMFQKERDALEARKEGAPGAHVTAVVPQEAPVCWPLLPMSCITSNFQPATQFDALVNEDDDSNDEDAAVAKPVMSPTKAFKASACPDQGCKSTDCTHSTMPRMPRKMSQKERRTPMRQATSTSTSNSTSTSDAKGLAPEATTSTSTSTSNEVTF